MWNVHQLFLMFGFGVMTENPSFPPFVTIQKKLWFVIFIVCCTKTCCRCCLLEQSWYILQGDAQHVLSCLRIHFVWPYKMCTLWSPKWYFTGLCWRWGFCQFWSVHALERQFECTQTSGEVFPHSIQENHLKVGVLPVTLPPVAVLSMSCVCDEVFMTLKSNSDICHVVNAYMKQMSMWWLQNSIDWPRNSAMAHSGRLLGISDTSGEFGKFGYTFVLYRFKFCGVWTLCHLANGSWCFEGTTLLQTGHNYLQVSTV